MALKDVIETMRVYNNPESGLDENLIKTLKDASKHWSLFMDSHTDNYLYLFYPGKQNFKKDLSREFMDINKFDYVIRIPVKKGKFFSKGKPTVNFKGFEHIGLGAFVSKNDDVEIFPDTQDTITVRLTHYNSVKNHNDFLKTIPKIKDAANKVYQKLESKGIVKHYAR